MKPFSIAGIEIKNRYVLAPLAGFTDYAMRKISYDYGAGLLYTEMESCEALCFQSKLTLEDIKNTKLDKANCPDGKLVLQIFGGKEESILKSIPIIEQYGEYDFLDFNCGCPVPKVIKQHSGSYWLNREEELIPLLKKMVSISSKPVIVKIRIGYSEIMDIVPLCKKIEEVGVKAIAVHGRTRNEYFSSPVHYDVIKDIKKNLTIPVIANGEITQDNFQEVIEKTDADAVMIGQHAIGYPKIFADMIAKEENREVTEKTLESQLHDLERHLELIYSIKDERSASSIMRSFAVNYVKGFSDSKKYRNLLVHCSSKEEYDNAIKVIREDFNAQNLLT